MLEILDWNTQIPTLIDLVEYYLSQGVVFSVDLINLNHETDSKENIKGIKITKQESIKEKTQKFVTRIEKSKSYVEIQSDFGNSYKKEENWKILKEFSEKETFDLVNRIEKESKNLTNAIIKGKI